MLLPHSLPPSLFVLFFPFLLETFTRFFHPHASLPAACEVKWKGTEAADFKMHMPSGRDGYEAAGGAAELLQPVNNKIGDKYCKI